ncbi:MAG: peptidase M42 [Chloroflexota bacterium]
MLDTNFVDILKTLVRQPSVVGAEHAFFRVIQRELEELGVTVTWYEGLLVAQGSTPHAHMFSAHIDRHGLICTGPNEFQYAAYVTGQRSDLLNNSVSEAMINKVKARFEHNPVMAYEPWSGVYLGSGEINHAYTCDSRRNLIFEVENLSHMVAGTPLAFQDRLRIEDGRLVAQLDNVLTTAMLVYLFHQGYQGTAFFTAQEESGKSWRYLLEWFRRFEQTTDNLIVLDTSPYPTLKAVANQDVVLRYCDANGTFNRQMSQQLADCCDRLGVRYSFKDEFVRKRNEQLKAEGKSALSLGSTELGRIVAASDGLVQGTTLQVPTIGYHTMNESVGVETCSAFLKVLMEIVGGG